MTTQLGQLQHAIMTVLWRHGRATAAEVHRELFEERGLAPTTIATMLTKMEKKGVVDHDTEGRRYVYRPTVSESEVRRSNLTDVTERWFEGSTGALVSHLISEHEIDPEELAELKRQVDRATRATASQATASKLPKAN